MWFNAILTGVRNGRLLALRGQHTEALASGCCTRHGDDPQTRQWRGYVLGDCAVRRSFSGLLELRGLCDPQIEINIGRMLLALRRFDEAEDVLTEVNDPSAEQLLNAIPDIEI